MEKTGDPVKLMESTRAGIQAHADLNEEYGLCQPEATLGCHPWLRDSLATVGEDEPGNAEPVKGQKQPFNDD